MDGWLDALPWLTGGLVLAAALVVLRRPVEWLLGAALRTGSWDCDKTRRPAAGTVGRRALSRGRLTPRFRCAIMGLQGP